MVLQLHFCSVFGHQKPRLCKISQARLTSTTPARYQKPNFISLRAVKGTFYPELTGREKWIIASSLKGQLTAIGGF